MNTVFVTTIGDTLVSAAVTLEDAQANVLARETRYSGADIYDYRWDEYHPGRVWRLMQRHKGPEGKGRRFWWTAQAVHAVGMAPEVAR